MSNLIYKNRKAYFEYEILDKYVAGIKLQGSEVKSIRSGKCSINEAYCYINKGEIFIKGMHISQHKEGGKHNNHIEVVDRKLLLNKKEILKLDGEMSQKGLTIIPLSVMLTTTGFIKIEISLSRGKNLHDKRHSIKEKDIKRDIERNV